MQIAESLTIKFKVKRNSFVRCKHHENRATQKGGLFALKTVIKNRCSA